MTYEQTLPISLQSFKFDSDLLQAPKMVKNFVHQFRYRKEIFDMQESYNKNNGLDLANKNSLFNN